MFQAAGKGQGTGVGVWELCTCSSPFGHSLQVPQTHCYWLKLYQGTRCCSPRLQISSNSWSGKQAANSWKVELLWLIWKRIRTETVVCAAVLGRVVQQLHLFFSPPPGVWFLLLWFHVIRGKNCRDYILHLSAVITTLITKRIKVRKADLITLDTCSHWEKDISDYSVMYAWDSLVLEYVQQVGTAGETENTVLCRICPPAFLDQHPSCPNSTNGG